MIKGMGKRIVRARKAAGKTRIELAAALGVDERTMIKYESDQLFITDRVLIDMSDFLNVHPEYFFRLVQVDIGDLEYNNSFNLSNRELEQIIEKIAEKAERIFEVAAILKTDPVPEFIAPTAVPHLIASLEDAKSAALSLAKEWGIVPGQNTIHLIEAHGILVFSLRGVTTKIKGLSTTINGFPVIAAHGRKFKQQQNAIAHELGRIALKGKISGLDEEEACNAFADALTPGDPEDWEEIPELDQSYLLEKLTMRAFEEDRIPSSTAARLLGMSSFDFQELLEKS